MYIHGMGGGGDSRIPSILREYFSCHSLHGEMGQESDVEIICRTYDFDPEVAQVQIRAWVDELHPELIIGESLGALHAMNQYSSNILLIWTLAEEQLEVRPMLHQMQPSQEM